MPACIRGVPEWVCVLLLWCACTVFAYVDVYVCITLLHVLMLCLHVHVYFCYGTSVYTRTSLMVYLCVCVHEILLQWTLVLGDMLNFT